MNQATITESQAKKLLELAESGGSAFLDLGGEKLELPIQQFIYGVIHEQLPERVQKSIEFSTFDLVVVEDNQKPKKMTVADIERELGYPVEVVK